MARALLK
jgi:hypothetical protein